MGDGRTRGSRRVVRGGASGTATAHARAGRNAGADRGSGGRVRSPAVGLGLVRRCYRGRGAIAVRDASGRCERHSGAAGDGSTRHNRDCGCGVADRPAIGATNWWSAGARAHDGRRRRGGVPVGAWTRIYDPDAARLLQVHAGVRDVLARDSTRRRSTGGAGTLVRAVASFSKVPSA